MLAVITNAVALYSQPGISTYRNTRIVILNDRIGELRPVSGVFQKDPGSIILNP